MDKVNHEETEKAEDVTKKRHLGASLARVRIPFHAEDTIKMFWE